MLEYAALLHDIGRAIDHERHHRHSAYLIRHAELLDFDADEVDIIQANEWREIGYATRELLVDRVNRLSGALDRLEDGDYGTCVECGEAIAPARLRVMPEVETCVRCQDQIERYGRQLEAVEAEAGVSSDDD